MRAEKLPSGLAYYGETHVDLTHLMHVILLESFKFLRSKYRRPFIPDTAWVGVMKLSQFVKEQTHFTEEIPS